MAHSYGWQVGSGQSGILAGAGNRGAFVPLYWMLRLPYSMVAEF